MGLFLWQLTLAMVRGGAGFWRVASGPVAYGVATALTLGVVAALVGAAEGLTVLLLQRGLAADNFRTILDHPNLGFSDNPEPGQLDRCHRPGAAAGHDRAVRGAAGGHRLPAADALPAGGDHRPGGHRTDHGGRAAGQHDRDVVLAVAALDVGRGADEARAGAGPGGRREHAVRSDRCGRPVRGHRGSADLVVLPAGAVPACWPSSNVARSSRARPGRAGPPVSHRRAPSPASPSTRSTRPASTRRCTGRRSGPSGRTPAPPAADRVAVPWPPPPDPCAATARPRWTGSESEPTPAHGLRRPAHRRRGPRRHRRSLRRRGSRRLGPWHEARQGTPRRSATRPRSDAGRLTREPRAAHPAAHRARPPSGAPGAVRSRARADGNALRRRRCAAVRERTPIGTEGRDEGTGSRRATDLPRAQRCANAPAGCWA